MGLASIVLFSVLLATGFAEVAHFTDCSNVEICSIGEVRITPCKKPDNCHLKKGSDALLSFDFTPNFSISKLKTSVYWDNSAMEVQWAGFGSNDACTYTTCPTEAGKQQTLNYNLHISKKLPKGLFKLKWIVWNEDNTAQECCFRTTISLKK